MFTRLACVSLLVVMSGCVNPGETRGDEPSGKVSPLFQWSPVRIGAGGFVTGFITHPLDASLRYCRTDVGNAYRWDGREWIPMVIREAGRGMPDPLALSPTRQGVESIALDPSDRKVVYVACGGARSRDVAALYPPVKGRVYKSVDGGLTFTGSDLAVVMKPNGDWRTMGERLNVDPCNRAIVYCGTLGEGLWRSVDGGTHWAPMTGNGAPATNQNVIAVHFSPSGGTVPVGGHPATRFVYAVTGDGAVRRSEDGGGAWTDITAGLALAGKCGRSTITAKGDLYVVANRSRMVWRYREGQWTNLTVRVAHDLGAVAIDPANDKNLFAISRGGSVSRSRDGGASWSVLGDMQFANTLGWLPQPPGWRSNAGIVMDRDGVVWVPQGNEGIMKWQSANDGSTNSPRWTIDSQGIEELVTHDVIMPPGGPMVVAVEDATGMVIEEPARFTARQIPLQDQLISNGTGLNYCPNAPSFLAIITTDVNWTKSGKSFSGYSSDGGRTWSRFASLPSGADGKPYTIAGSIAVSRRGAWGLGEDHLVWAPTGKMPPFYSHDGGRSWKPGTGFPEANGYWNFSLKQRLLAADPFVPDRFYFHGSWRGGFYVSTDGGQTWQKQDRASLPAGVHHGQLAVNPKVRDDLWFVDGWEGASQHGLWHSTDGGQTFLRMDGFENGLTLCLGAGRGWPGDAPYAVYVYGRRTEAAEWGVFRSLDAGGSWERVSFYPGGIFDLPTCMASSWDTFGVVVVGFTGNSYVIGSAKKEKHD